MANLVVRRPNETSFGTWDPFRLLQEMVRWDPSLPSRTYTDERFFSPEFEAKETEDKYVFRADLPGLEEKDVEINVTGNQLTIAGKREAEQREEGETYFTYERRYGSFSRSFALPDGANLDTIEAELRNGVLTVSVPKRPEVKPRRISIHGVVDNVKQLGSGGDEPKT